MDNIQLLALGLYGFFMGLERAGIRSVNMPVIPFVISALGPMTAMGYMLPIVLITDIFSVAYYRRSADIRILLHTLPGAFLGIVTGTLVGQRLSVPLFKGLVGCIIIVSLCFIIYNETGKKSLVRPDRALFPGLVFAYFTGLASMLGAAGSPVILSYLLMLNIEKEKLIGTSAFFFLFVNLVKLPMYIFVWKNLNMASFLTDLMLLPVMGLGLAIGFFLVRKFNTQNYRKFIIAVSFVSAVRLFF